MIKKEVVIGSSSFICSHLTDPLSDLGRQLIIHNKTRLQWLCNDQKILYSDVQVIHEVNHKD